MKCLIDTSSSLGSNTGSSTPLAGIQQSQTPEVSFKEIVVAWPEIQPWLKHGWWVMRTVFCQPIILHQRSCICKLHMELQRGRFEVNRRRYLLRHVINFLPGGILDHAFKTDWTDPWKEICIEYKTQRLHLSFKTVVYQELLEKRKAFRERHTVTPLSYTLALGKSVTVSNSS